MVNLREQAETDLAVTLEGDFGLPVDLIGPDGIKQSVTGQILYDTIVVSPDTGQEMILNHPVVTLRRSTLNRIPAAGETWYVSMPTTPTADPTAPKEDFIFDSGRPPEGGASIGYIRLYLRKVAQVDDEL